MSEDLEWAMTQGSLFFEDRGKVQESLRRITKRLEDLGIGYAIVGGMAMYLHGFRRYTEDVGILVTKESANRIYEALEGRGYVRPFANSKNLRDTESGVKVEMLLSGGFPVDGKPKPVSFPDPAKVAEMIHGIQCINLPTLVQLKLASGMTAPDRLKDLADVQELIRMLHLSQEFGERLDAYVRPKFEELWTSVQPSGTNEP
jgi:hypothetical protein